MSPAWRDASASSGKLSEAADAYTHWAAAGGIRHLWPDEPVPSAGRHGRGPKRREPQHWLAVLVEWQQGTAWYDAMRALRKHYRRTGASLQITTLPGHLAGGKPFEFAAVALAVPPKADKAAAVRRLAALLLKSGARRIELSLPLREHPERGLHDDDDAAAQAVELATERGLGSDDEPVVVPASGVYKLLCVIDDVIPFGHTLFKQQLHALWLQGEDRNGHVNELILSPGVRRCAVRTDLRRDLQPAAGGQVEDALTLPQRRLVLPRDWDAERLHDVAVKLGFTGVRRRMSHGAHVIGLALGMASRERASAALDAGPPPRLVGVQLPWHAVQDTSGRWLGRHMLAGLIYALDCAWWLPGHRQPGNQPAQPLDATTPRHVVANISYGHTTGPHDGSSILEAAMDDLCRRFPRQAPASDEASGSPGVPPIALDICLPAGNSFSARCHAVLDVPSHGQQVLTWRVLPDGQRPAFLELWLSADHAVALAPLELEIQPPGPHMPPLCVHLGSAAQWTLDDRGQTAFVRSCAVLPGPPMAPAPQVEGPCRWLVLIALEPTACDQARTVKSWRPGQAGDWQLSLRNASSRPVQAQVYVARSTPHLYSRRDGTLSYLLDPNYDPDRYLRAREDDQPGQTVLRRGTLNGIGTGQETQVATGIQERLREGSELPELVHPLYASAGGAGLGQLRRAPDFGFITDKSRALPGVLSCGNHDASHVRLVGTSSAAPQMARHRLAAQAQRSIAQSSGDKDLSGTLVVKR